MHFQCIVVESLFSRRPGERVYVDELLDMILSRLQYLNPEPKRSESDISAQHRQIDSKQALSVATILNELISNAGEYSQAGHKEHKFRLGYECKPESIVVEVSNPGNLPPNFDFSGGEKLGTGLQLVRAILPKQGADLSIQDVGNEVMARLEMVPPLLLELKKQQKEQESWVVTK